MQGLCPGVSAADSPENQPMSPLGAGLATEQRRPSGLADPWARPLWRWPSVWPRLAGHVPAPARRPIVALEPEEAPLNDCQAVEPGKAD